jgi:hypothetical protein
MKYSEFIKEAKNCKKIQYKNAIANPKLGTEAGEACARRSSSSAGGD